MPPPHTDELRESSDPPLEDQGEIRCICGFTDDDGFTVQCENCLVWQHVVCVINGHNNVPEEYLCEVCDPRELDAKRAHSYQAERLESEYKNAQVSRRRNRNSGGRPRKPQLSPDGSLQGPTIDRRKKPSTAARPRGKPSRPAQINTDSHDQKYPYNGHGEGSESPGLSSVTDRGYSPIDKIIIGSDDVLALFQDVANKLQVTEVVVDDFNPVVHLSNTFAVLSAKVSSDPTPIYTDIISAADPPMYGVFSSQSLSRGTYVGEYKGQVDLKSEYTGNPKNYFNLLKTTRPLVTFHPQLDLCVDSRKYGNKFRFIRRSCKPNTILRSTFIKGSDDPFIHIGVFASKDIGENEELTMCWNWDGNSMPSIANRTSSHVSQYLQTPEGRRLTKIWRQTFAGYSCACNRDQNCEANHLLSIFGANNDSVDSHTRATNGHQYKRSVQMESSPQSSDKQNTPSPSSHHIRRYDDPKQATESTPYLSTIYPDGKRETSDKNNKRAHEDKGDSEEPKSDGLSSSSTNDTPDCQFNLNPKVHKRKSQTPEITRQYASASGKQAGNEELYNNELRTYSEKRRRKTMNNAKSEIGKARHRRLSSVPFQALKKLWLKQYLVKAPLFNSTKADEVAKEPSSSSTANQDDIVAGRQSPLRNDHNKESASETLSKSPASILVNNTTENKPLPPSLPSRVPEDDQITVEDEVEATAQPDQNTKKRRYAQLTRTF